LPDIIAKWDGKYAGLGLSSWDSWQIPRIPRCTWKRLNYTFFSLVWLWNAYVGSGFRWTTNSQWTNDSKPVLHHPQYSTFAIYCEIGQPGRCNEACQLTLSHICHY
jgi:hypothetical protein